MRQVIARIWLTLVFGGLGLLVVGMGLSLMLRELGVVAALGIIVGGGAFVWFTGWCAVQLEPRP